MDDVPAALNIARGLPVELLAPGATTAAERARALEEDAVHDFAREACEIAHSLADAESIGLQLAKRCHRAVTLTEDL